MNLSLNAIGCEMEVGEIAKDAFDCEDYQWNDAGWRCVVGMSAIVLCEEEGRGGARRTKEECVTLYGCWYKAKLTFTSK